MSSIILSKLHLPILKNEMWKDEFIAGIISILQGNEPQTASCSYLKDTFHLLVHGKRPKFIPGIPKFDPTGIKKSELERYNQIQAGRVPSTGLDHSYADLKFKAITKLDKDYLSELFIDCQNRINSKQGTPEYRRFIGYLAEVMKHCAESGEL